MNENGGGLGFLDALAILSFVLQLQNNSKIFGIDDVQQEMSKAVGEIHAHLEKQDSKIDEILKELYLCDIFKS